MDSNLHRLLLLLRERGVDSFSSKGSGNSGSSTLAQRKATPVVNVEKVKLPPLDFEERVDFNISFESSFVFEGGPIASYDSRWLSYACSSESTHNSINRKTTPTPTNTLLAANRKRPMTPRRGGDTPKKARTTTTTTMTTTTTSTPSSSSIVHTSFHAKR